MGYWYWRNLKNGWAQDESADNSFDLPSEGHLSGLKITVEQKNAAYLCEGYDNPYPVNRINPQIFGNGNEQIINLRGTELEGMNFWETGKLSPKILWTVTGQTLSEELFIPFGRFLGDMKKGLILERWKSGVQFKDANTWSTSYVTDTYQKYTIDGLFRKNPEAGLFADGYLSKKHVADEESAARTQHEVKLPTKQKLKQIYVFTVPDLTDVTSYLPSITPFSNIGAMWLSINSLDEYIINNKTSGFIAYMMHQLYGRKAKTWGISGGGGTDALYIDTKIYERHETTFGAYNSSTVIPVEDAATNLERILKCVTYTDAGAAAARQFYWTAEGICPHGIIPLLLQDPKSDKEDWLDAGAVGDVHVAASEGTSGYGKWRIVLDELQAHPAL